MSTAMKNGLERTIQNRDQWRALLDMLKQVSPEMQDPIMEGFVELMLAHDEESIKHIGTGSPVVSA